MICRIELEVPTNSDPGDTTSELAMKLNHSERYLSRAYGWDHPSLPLKSSSCEWFMKTVLLQSALK